MEQLNHEQLQPVINDREDRMHHFQGILSIIDNTALTEAERIEMLGVIVEGGDLFAARKRVCRALDILRREVRTGAGLIADKPKKSKRKK